MSGSLRLVNPVIQRPESDHDESRPRQDGHHLDVDDLGKQAATAQSQAAQGGDSAEAKLAQLDSMLKKGYITQAEYNAKKKEILANM